MQEHKNEAIILLGHGSRIPGAGEGMEQVARQMREKLGRDFINTCYMSKLGPHFPEVFEQCVARVQRRSLSFPISSMRVFTLLKTYRNCFGKRPASIRMCN